MTFSKHLSQEVKELLTTQYKDYIKETPMTKKEMSALREWVKDGNSVYENPRGAWAEGQVPVEFLTIYREEEYIRENTKGMNSEEARKFAMAYYGWNDDEVVEQDFQAIPGDMKLPDYAVSEEELPFS